jgi:HAD superfamily hydrolase (TIGR01509 family)
MIEAVVFDMDGVLIDARDWHYEALNEALGLFGYTISRTEHLKLFDGLPTAKKLRILSDASGLPRSLHSFINELKQSYTMRMIYERCQPMFAHEYALANLNSAGYRLAVASNSVRATVETMMDRSRLRRYLDVLLSNEDVENAKPDPEIYVLAMQQLKSTPETTLIVEDNEHGIQAARASGAHVLEVRDPSEVTLENLRRAIAEAEATTC